MCNWLGEKNFRSHYDVIMTSSIGVFFEANFVTTQVFSTSIYTQKVAFKIKSEASYLKDNHFSFPKIIRNLFLARCNMALLCLKKLRIFRNFVFQNAKRGTIL